MRQPVYENETDQTRRLIPLKVKVLFWLLVLLIGAYSLYVLLPYPRLVLEVAQAGHIVLLWIIHR